MNPERRSPLASITPKGWIFGLSLLSVLLITLMWLSGHSFISIAVDNAADGEIDFSLVNQEDRKESLIKSSSHNVKRLVKKGSYEITATKAGGNYFVVVEAGGFLKTITVHGSLSAERARRFVGNNPSPCMTYSGNVLLSYQCSGSTFAINSHLPASQSIPTTVQTYNGPIEGTIEGVFSISGGNYALIQLRDLGEEQQASHAIYKVGDSLDPASKVTLEGLNPNNIYSVKAYKQGFVIYDSEFSNVVYYSSPTAKPETIKFEHVTDPEFEAYASNVLGDTIVALYTNLEYEPRPGDKAPAGNKVHYSKLVVNKDGASKQLTLDRQYGSVDICGVDRICLLGDKQLEVYDISGKKAKLLYRVGDALAIDHTGSQLLILRARDILALNVADRSGAIDFSLGGYTYCGHQTGANSYLVCVLDKRKQKMALLISRDQADIDSIDKKVFELSKLPSVDSVSAYANFIYVSPALGDLKYDPDQGGFDYDPVVKKRVNADINAAIDRIGIDRNKYKIVNTSE